MKAKQAFKEIASEICEVVDQLPPKQAQEIGKLLSELGIVIQIMAELPNLDLDRGKEK